MHLQCARPPILVRDARLFADLCYELTAASTKLIVRSISGLFCMELMFGQDINCSPQVRLHPRSVSQTNAYRARMQTPLAVALISLAMVTGLGCLHFEPVREICRVG